MAEALRLLRDGPARGPTLALAHGAGDGMDTPFLETVAHGLAGRGLQVVRFEFPFMAARRQDGRRRGPDREPALRATWTEVVTALGGGAQLFVGGKSLGGRIASLVADELGVRGLVCLGYPFHPPGRPERTRTAHLRQLSTPTLIVQGTRDPFGRPDEVAGYDLSRCIRVQWIEDGDHDLRPRKRSGRDHAQNLEQAIEAVAGFVRAAPPA